MPATRTKHTPSPLEAHLGFWLRFVSNHVSIRFQQLLEDKGVTVTEWVALRTLWSQDETTHAELILALGMTKGAASKVVSRLEEKGLAERRLAEGRAREQCLALTAAGKALVLIWQRWPTPTMTTTLATCRQRSAKRLPRRCRNWCNTTNSNKSPPPDSTGIT